MENLFKERISENLQVEKTFMQDIGHLSDYRDRLITAVRDDTSNPTSTKDDLSILVRVKFDLTVKGSQITDGSLLDTMGFTNMQSKMFCLAINTIRKESDSYSGGYTFKGILEVYFVSLFLDSAKFHLADPSKSLEFPIHSLGKINKLHATSIENVKKYLTILHDAIQKLGLSS